MSEPQFFDYIDDLTNSKKDFSKSHTLKNYVPYAINNFLSFDQSCFIDVAILNSMSKLSKEWHYKYLINSLYKRKRYIKYFKQENNEVLDVIMFIYNVSKDKAKDYERLLSKKQIKEITEIYEHLNNKNNNVYKE